jgi:hypothetical protein
MDMNLFLQNNDNLLPRDQVHIERVAAIPHPDRRRVKVQIDVTPFRERPNFEIIILDQDGRQVASTSVIATMHFKMEFNLHLRHVDDTTGHYTVRVQMYYDDIRSPQDIREVALHILSDD